MSDQYQVKHKQNLHILWNMVAGSGLISAQSKRLRKQTAMHQQRLHDKCLKSGIGPFHKFETGLTFLLKLPHSFYLYS